MIKFNRIILEINDKCNYKCNWCIRNIVDSNNKIISTSKIKKILKIIYKNINCFEQPLVFSLFRFDEPLLKIKNLQKTSYIIKKFFQKRNIKTFIYIHSNGSLINDENILLELKNIDMIKINDYNNDGIIKILEKISKFKNVIIKEIIKNNNERDEIVCYHNNKKIVFYVNSSKDLHIMSKGGAIKNSTTYIRKEKCDIIGKIFVLELNGDVMACCETYNKIHKEFIVGNIYKNNFQEIIDSYKNINTLTHKYCHDCEMSTNYCDVNHKEEALKYAN